MASISASMATLQFNRIFSNNVKRFDRSNIYYKQFEEDELQTDEYKKFKKDEKYSEVLQHKVDIGAIFDSRVFSIPKEEVNNCFVWRQQDATRNSIQMVGQSNFSHKELHKKSCNVVQDMLFKERDINWNDFNTPLKRGACIIKQEYLKETDNAPIVRTRWIVDKNIPIFSEDKNYIEQYVFLED